MNLLIKPNGSIDVGGITSMTSTDFPGQLACVVFLQGCPWRCTYCHNTHLLSRKGANTETWEKVKIFLQNRKGLLDAVVFSGGEPTLQKGLVNAIREVKAMGFKVGIHTGGSYPARFREILPDLDWVGFDVKSLFHAYEKITGVPRSGERARESLFALLQSGVAYEVRTTVHPHLHTGQELLVLGKELAGLGVKRYVLQEFRETGCSDRTLAECHGESPINGSLEKELEAMFSDFTVRRSKP